MICTTRSPSRLPSTPHIYTLNIRAQTSNPNDSTIYYFGSLNLAWATTASYCRMYIPKAGKIVAAVVYFYVAGAAGTAEDVPLAIRKNNTTDYTITDNLHLNAAQVLASNYSLNIPVVSGDYVELKLTAPAWVTNPTSIYVGGHILIEC